VELLRPAPALSIGCRERVTQALALDALGDHDRGGSARGKRPERALVVVAERLRVRLAIERKEHPEPARAVGERDSQRRPRAADA